MSAPVASLHRDGDGTFVVRVSGDWSLEAPIPPSSEAVTDLRNEVPSRVVFQAVDLGHWDSSLVAYLVFVSEVARGEAATVDTTGLPHGLQHLLALAAGPRRPTPPPPPHPTIPRRVGVAAIDFWDHSLGLLDFVGRASLAVKEVLIDERDRYLASKIFDSKDGSIVAVVGAGHMGGIEDWLKSLDAGDKSPDVTDIESVPPASRWTKAAGWLIPALIVVLIGLGFFRSGSAASLSMVLRWILLNGSLAALGSALCLAHPLTILVSFLLAPVATLNPFVGIGLFAGVAEAYLRKPRVQDFERLTEDVASLKGFYRNRVTHILLIFFLSSIGGMIGNFIALPLLASKVIG